MPGNQLFTPHQEWEHQRARGEQVQRQLLARLHDLPGVRLVDATFHVHPDVATRFAAFPPAQQDADAPPPG